VSERAPSHTGFDATPVPVLHSGTFSVSLEDRSRIGDRGQTCGGSALDGEQSHVFTKEKRMLLLIILIVLILGFGYGGYRVGPGWGYYGGGGVSLILTIVLILLLLRVI
jgi:Protein of unknown function (DUF3309)